MLKKVLIVEDDPETARLIAIMLEMFGFHTAIADSCRKALQDVARHDVDYLFMDLTLPDGDGLDLYENIILKYPQFRGKAIFCSGKSLNSLKNTKIEKDRIPFLPKPFTLEQLSEYTKKWK